VLAKPLSRNPRHHFIGGVNAPTAVEPEREGKGLGNFVDCGWPELRITGHVDML
jgi:hypothetical protein